MSFSRLPSVVRFAWAAALAGACSPEDGASDDAPFLEAGGLVPDGGDANEAGRDAAPPPTLADWADLRADVNRDGRVTLEGDEDDAHEDAWGPAGGAVFLANLDDDSERCPDEGSDEGLAGCH